MARPKKDRSANALRPRARDLFGFVTMQVVDAEIRDMELIYAFATMEQADKAEALAILPDVLDGTAKRKDVQAALKAVLSSNVETGPEEDKRTGDLFADQEQEIAPPCPTTENPEIAEIQAKLDAATAILKAILEQPKTHSPLQKWEFARELARNFIDPLGTDREQVSQAKT